MCSVEQKSYDFQGTGFGWSPIFIGIIAKAPLLPEFFGKRGVIFLLLFLSPHLKNKGIKRSLGELLSKFHAKYSLRLERPPALFSHKRLMDDMFGVQYSISVENQPYPVLCTITADGCIAHVPDFPKIAVHTPTLDAALLEVKQQIQKALRQYKNRPSHQTGADCRAGQPACWYW